MEVDPGRNSAQRDRLDPVSLRGPGLFGEETQPKDLIDIAQEGLARPLGAPPERVRNLRLECHRGANHGSILASTLRSAALRAERLAQ